MRMLFASVYLSLVCVAGATPAAQSDDHALLGKWQFDASKSSFSGAIPYQSATITYARAGSGIKVVQDIVEGTSQKLHFEYLDTRDGRDAKVIGNPFYDSESTQWPDRLTAVRSEKRAGKVTGTTTMKVAQDGRSYAATASRMLPSGGLYTSVIVWNRVPD